MDREKPSRPYHRSELPPVFQKDDLLLGPQNKQMHMDFRPSRRSSNLRSESTVSSRKEFPGSRSQGASSLETFPCDRCDKVFSTKNGLIAHVNLHDSGEIVSDINKIEYACDICDRRFEQPKSLKMHSIKYHKVRLENVTPHKRVQKESSPVTSLPQVKNEVMEEIPIECNICFHLFDSEHALDEHINIEHKDLQSANDEDEEEFNDAKPECIYCFQTLKNNLGLVNHLRTAHGKPSCVVCLEIFDTQEALSAHRSKAHTRGDDNVSAATHYQPSISSKSNDDHTEGSKMHTCDICDKSFDRYISLAIHKGHHKKMGGKWVPADMIERNGAFRCEKCGKSFEKEISFIRHKAYHSKMGPGWIPLAIVAAKQAEAAVSGTDKVTDEPDSKQKSELAEDNEEYVEDSDDTEYQSSVTVPKVGRKRKVGLNYKNLQKNYSNIPYCLYCKKIYDDHKKLWDHVRKCHASEERYKCPYSDCQRVFFTGTGYKSHLRKHRDQGVEKTVEYSSSSASTPSSSTPDPSPSANGDSQCTVCFKQFVSKANVKRHMIEKHGGAPLFKCGYCPKVYLRKEHILRHELVHQLGTNATARSRGVVNSKSLCRYCPKMLSKKYLIEHEKLHRRAGAKPLMRNRMASGNGKSSEKNVDFDFTEKKKKPWCKYCNAQPSTFEELKSHLKEHPGKPYYQCSKCPEIYYEPNSLKSHANRHTRSISSCRHCKRPFVYLQKLIKHEKLCTGPPAGSGSNPASSSSANSTALQEPKVENPNNSPIYTCNFCGSQFLEAQSFVQHLQSHARS